MPDALELPRVLGAVVPLMRPGRAGVRELVAHRLPGLPSVVGALNLLTEPAARLRGVQAVRSGRRAFDVIDLPAREVRAGDVPPAALSVGRQDKRALARTDQDPYPAHRPPLSS